MGGWIKLHRRIQDHWLWHDKPFDRRSAWIDLLLLASHTESKAVNGNEIIVIERGSIVTSERKLADRWGWSRTKVRAFLDLLEEDGMIRVAEKNHKRTTISIVNYSVFQDSETTKEPLKDHKKTTQETDLESFTFDFQTTKEPQKDRHKANNDNASVVFMDHESTEKEPRKDHEKTTEEPHSEPKKDHIYKNKEDKNVKKEKKGDIYILSSNSPADAGEERATSPKKPVSSPKEHMPPLAGKEPPKQEPPHTPPSPKSRDETPYTEIVAAWNEMARASGLPTVQRLTDGRKKAIRARWNDEGGDRYPDEAFKAFKAVFDRVAASDFLTGRKDGSSWRATFDWVLKPDKWARVMEGVYDNKPEAMPRKRMPRAFESLLELMEDAKAGRVGGSIFDA